MNDGFVRKGRKPYAGEEHWRKFLALRSQGKMQIHAVPSTASGAAPNAFATSLNNLSKTDLYLLRSFSGDRE